MMDYYYELASGSSSWQDSLLTIEAHIQRANVLAASLPRSKNGSCLQMKLVCNQLAPIFVLLVQWMECSYSCLFSSYFNLFHVGIYNICSDGKPKISSLGRKATIKEFYSEYSALDCRAMASIVLSDCLNIAAVILPWLQRLHRDSIGIDSIWEGGHGMETVNSKKIDDRRRFSDADLDREDECGICLETCTKMVVPSCCHAMCINCYRDWNTRSESCPFCRGSLKRVNSGDLWVLPCNSDMVDTKTVLKEDILRFFLYVNELPKDIPDALFLMYYEYLI